MRKGFTLLELIVVIIIIGILATLGITQYTKIVEKGRIAEARVILGQIRTSEVAYSQEYGNYTSTLTDLYIGDVPGTCTATHYFSYAALATDGQGTATRCTGSNGKAPGGPSAYTVTMAINGTISGNTPGYY